jgi:amino acid transporter
MNTFIMIESLLAFAVSAWLSLNSLKEGSVSISFVIMLIAIFVLFVGYEALSDSLEESLKASK